MPTIQINIHPDAVAKFDANATALLAFVGHRPQTRPAPPAFPDDIETSETPDKDIEDFRSEVRDGTGQVVERLCSANIRFWTRTDSAVRLSPSYGMIAA